MKEGISVIVCCYNSQSRLPETLRHLIAQKASGINWEIIVVDNASNDKTSETATHILNAALPADKYKVVNEPEPGLSNARKCGYLNSQYDLLLFCDDDNWMNEHYFEIANNIMRNNKHIGILGGWGEAVFEKSKPDWFDKYQTNFAVGPQGPDTATFAEVYGSYGAGFIVRRQLFNNFDAVGFKSLLSDRKGNQLVSGGDTETCIIARMLGYTIAYSPALKFKHLMTDGRMKWEYLKKLHYGFGQMRLYLHAYDYVKANNKIPGEGLRFPLWLDKYIHLTKQLFKYYPGIWLKLNNEGDDTVLKYMALKGEMAELKNLKDNYPKVFESILLLKQRIETFKKQQTALQ